MLVYWRALSCQLPSRRRRWPQLFATSNGFARKRWISVGESWRRWVAASVSRRIAAVGRQKPWVPLRCSPVGMTFWLMFLHFGRAQTPTSSNSSEEFTHIDYRVMSCMFDCSFSSSAIILYSFLRNSSNLTYHHPSGRWKVVRRWRNKVMRKTWVCHTFLSCSWKNAISLQLAHLTPWCSRDPIWKNHEKHASSLFTLPSGEHTKSN